MQLEEGDESLYRIGDGTELGIAGRYRLGLMRIDDFRGS
jgi:hypothetical protein